MAECKHTPGPWEIDGILTVDGIEVSAGVYWMPADDDLSEDDLICKASISNARLIAAAPDLLESAKPFDAGAWFAEGVLRDHRSDGLKITLTLDGTTYEPITATVGELRALSAAIAKAEARP